MSYTEHTIVLEDGMEITIKQVDEVEHIYDISSDSERFQSVFGVSSFQLKAGDSELERSILNQIVPGNKRSEAETILNEIKHVL